MLWAGNEFHFIKKIQNVIPAPISDIDVNLNRKAIYTVCDHIQGMAVYFDSNFINRRDPMKNSTMQEAQPQDYNSKAFSTYYSTKNHNIGVKPQSRDNRTPLNPVNPLKSTIKDIYENKPIQHSKFDHMHRNFNIQSIEVKSTHLKRIQVSHDMSRIITGDFELKILERRNGQYEMVNFDNI